MYYLRLKPIQIIANNIFGGSVDVNLTLSFHTKLSNSNLKALTHSLFSAASVMSYNETIKHIQDSRLVIATAATFTSNKLKAHQK